MPEYHIQPMVFAYISNLTLSSGTESDPDLLLLDCLILELPNACETAQELPLL